MVIFLVKLTVGSQEKHDFFKTQTNHHYAFCLFSQITKHKYITKFYKSMILLAYYKLS